MFESVQFLDHRGRRGVFHAQPEERFLKFSSIFEVVHSRGAGTPTSSDVQFVCFDVLEFPKSTGSAGPLTNGLADTTDVTCKIV